MATTVTNAKVYSTNKGGIIKKDMKRKKRSESLSQSLLSRLEKHQTCSKHELEMCIKHLLQIFSHPPEPATSRLVNSTLEELSASIKVFNKFKQPQKISIFGSSRTKPSNPNYQIAEALSKKLTELGFHIITGAGPGIMEAGNKGALPEKSFGLNIELPFEQKANKYIQNSNKLISYRYFFLRKLFFIRESAATIIFPGGYGTHDEGFEILTLLQTGRCAPRPLLLMTYTESTYWETWENYIKTQLLANHYISEEDLSLFKICHDPDEAIQWIYNYYSVYHSIRYLNDFTVMRLNKALSKSTLKIINDKFQHLLLDEATLEGKFKVISHKEIPEEKELYPNKKRLVFKFNKTDFGGLNQLILELAKLKNK